MLSVRRIASAALLTLAAACRDHVPATGPAWELASVSRNLYGQGSDVAEGLACDAAGYHQLDFWVGHWNVISIRPDGTPNPGSVPSIIEKEIDGCVLEENFTGFARSINTYDASAGTYNQHYFDANGGQSVLTGTTRPDGAVEMTGRTLFACPACPGGIFPLINVWSWTQITPDSVRQLQLLFNGLNGLPRGRGFDGRYVRAASVTLPPTPPTGRCTMNPLHRQLDFLTGDWILMRGRANGREIAEGNGPVTSSVTLELAGCLVEERVHGPDGYKGWSFSGWNQSESLLIRTYANNLGERIFLQGTREGSTVVLTGTHAFADGTSRLVRMTWDVSDADRVEERWEVSTDGGTTYEPDLRFARLRRAP